MNPKKIAVILFNLGGPDRQEVVGPFLRNLFSDPAMIRLPAILRLPLARLIAQRRAKIARTIYAAIGGGSPILLNTEAQARALEQALAEYGALRVFTVMRYWHPFAHEIMPELKAFAPDHVVLLPLYPQFSTTTTASSFKDFHAYAASGLGAETKITTICCYPTDSGFIRAMILAIRSAYPSAAAFGQPRLLLSAHGLPEKYVSNGDPYQWQCEQTAAALARDLGISGLDWVLCYQSRVGPMRWIGPSVEDEIRRAGHDGVPVLVAPIAFVSEHSETLYEIEIKYRQLAQASGVPYFARIPAVGTAPEFIAGLARLVRRAMVQETPAASGSGEPLCPQGYCGCWLRA